jgi:hypothetical protein
LLWKKQGLIQTFASARKPPFFFDHSMLVGISGTAGGVQGFGQKESEFTDNCLHIIIKKVKMLIAPFSIRLKTNHLFLMP